MTLKQRVQQRKIDMKTRKTIFVLFIILGMATISTAQMDKSYIDVHGGYLDPKDTESGMLVGASLITSFDDAVDIGFGFDLFQKSYTKEAQVASSVSGDTQLTTYSTLVDYQRTVVPLYLSLKVKIPTTRSRVFGYFARASLSYQFLFSEEKNYEANISDSRKYKGLGWQAGGGIFYRVGRRSTLLAEAIYNNCSVGRDVTKNSDELPLTERINLSGLGFRFGVELAIK